MFGKWPIKLYRCEVVEIDALEPCWRRCVVGVALHDPDSLDCLIAPVLLPVLDLAAERLLNYGPCLNFASPSRPLMIGPLRTPTRPLP